MIRPHHRRTQPVELMASSDLASSMCTRPQQKAAVSRPMTDFATKKSKSLKAVDLTTKTVDPKVVQENAELKKEIANLRQGLADIARHLIMFHSAHMNRRTARCCSPRHRVPFSSSNEGPTCGMM